MIKIIIAVIILIFCSLIFDISELTPHHYLATIADKWHEESCISNYDDKGNYYGETCSDNFGLILDMSGSIAKEFVSHNSFYDRYRIGQSVRYSFDTGRLGLKHNVSIEPI